MASMFYWVTITLYVGMELLAPSHLNQSYIAPWFVSASYLFIPAARCAFRGIVSTDFSAS